jgi:hypothetical protein
MTDSDKRVFIHDLCENVKNSLLDSVDRMPEEWDGHELRQLIADRFALASWTLKEKNNRRRYRAYKNTVKWLFVVQKGNDHTPIIAQIEKHRPGNADRLPTDPRERNANARLIAESPALLGIAQDCLHQLSTDSDLDEILGAPKYRALVATLRDVIARATGEEA